MDVILDGYSPKMTDEERALMIQRHEERRVEHEKRDAELNEIALEIFEMLKSHNVSCAEYQRISKSLERVITHNATL